MLSIKYINQTRFLSLYSRRLFTPTI